MNQARPWTFLSAHLILPAAFAAAQATPLYTNAELVSLDIQTRQVIVKNTAGKQQTLLLDDTLVGLPNLHAGDRVILALREEPGMTRVSSIAKSQAPTARPSPPPTPPRPTQAVAATAPGLAAFAREVGVLAQQAGQVDTYWTDFKATCNVTLTANHPDGRDWFSLWESGSAQMDVSSGPCRDLYNQIVARGETVKAGMVGAEEAARKADIAPGDLREVRRRHAMEWGGWGLPSPELLKK